MLMRVSAPRSFAVQQSEFSLAPLLSGSSPGCRELSAPRWLQRLPPPRRATWRASPHATAHTAQLQPAMQLGAGGFASRRGSLPHALAVPPVPPPSAGTISGKMRSGSSRVAQQDGAPATLRDSLSTRGSALPCPPPRVEATVAARWGHPDPEQGLKGLTLRAAWRSQHSTPRRCPRGSPHPLQCCGWCCSAVARGLRPRSSAQREAGGCSTEALGMHGVLSGCSLTAAVAHAEPTTCLLPHIVVLPVPPGTSLSGVPPPPPAVLLLPPARAAAEPAQ